MKCRRCQREYEPDEAKVFIEDAKDRILASGKELYAENVDGLCEYCAMVTMLGYDRHNY